MARKKKQTAVMIKAPTKYTIIDEDGVIRGTAESYISAIDIVKEIGMFDPIEEVSIDQCLAHIYSSEVSLHGLDLKSGQEQEDPETQ